MIMGAALSAIGGCATREKLARADREEQIVLTEKVSYVTHSISGVRWEYIALPGIYVAERKDDQGVYFYGPGRSIVEITTLRNNLPHLLVGGIYLPNDPSRPSQLVWAFEGNPQTTADLDAYMTQRTVATTALPALQPGIGAGANIVGNVVGGAVVAGIIAAGEGELNRIEVKDPALSAKLREGRGPTRSAAAGQQLPQAVK
ncbi:hypothetical protein HHL11_03705 [Ramlibacter sp. G-1-2-2]|uniref:Uncharacterized protein n=1 Tax=Ramlibacter agri TaxID=2728837 RepID=A0A848GWV9_9BURK|nr:hypothetical protein [Ramlibacter agri]NML42844.1 hypothetical protein [Ramlibacter agri]